jgi:hypothetical protein
VEKFTLKIKYIFLRESFVCPRWIFIFDSDQAQINSVATSNEELERGFGEWRWMNELYECNYKCMKLKKVK